MAINPRDAQLLSELGGQYKSIIEKRQGNEAQKETDKATAAIFLRVIEQDRDISKIPNLRMLTPEEGFNSEDVDELHRIEEDVDNLVTKILTGQERGSEIEVTVHRIQLGRGEVSEGSQVKMHIVQQKKEGLPPLHIAIRNGDFESLKLLIESKPDLELQDEEGSTAFQLAMIGGNKECAIFLIKNGAKVSLEDKKKYLEALIEKGSLEVNDKELFEALINNDADTLNIPDSNQRTVLHLAVMTENIVLAQLIIKHGGNANLKDKEGLTPLHMAVRNGDLKSVILIVEKKADLEVLDGQGRTAFQWAMAEGNKELAIFLIKNGAKVSLEDKKKYLEALIEKGSLEVNDKELFEALINNDADTLNIPDSNQRTVLHLAVMTENIVLAQLIIKHGGNANLKDKEGLTPLHMAVRNGDLKSVILIVEKKADLEVLDGQGRTAFQWAMIEGNKELALLLIQSGAKVSLEDKKKYLEALIDKGSLEVKDKELFEALINNDADTLNILDSNQRTVLHLAVMTENIVLAQLIIKHGGNANLKDEEGLTPLHMAVSFDDPKSVMLFIENKADLEIQDSRGCTALQRAEMEGNMKLAHLLIKNGAKVNVNDINVDKIIHMAPMEDKKKYVEIIIAKGALEVRDKDGNTPLMHALMMDDEESAKLFILAGANVDNVYKDNRTALHIACEKGFADVVLQIVTKSKATLDSENKYKNTPLLRALMSGHGECARILIEKGADINQVNENGQKAIHIASEQGLSDTVNQLMVNGGDVNEVDKNGDSPILCALKLGQYGCAKFLIEKGVNLDKANEEFSEIIKLLKLKDSTDPVKLKQFSYDAYLLNSRYFKEFLEAPELDLAPELIEKFESDFNSEIRGIRDTALKKSQDSKTNHNDYKKELLLDLHTSFLKWQFRVQKEVMQKSFQTYPDFRERFKDLAEGVNSTWDAVCDSYINQQKELIKKQKNNTLISQEIFLTKNKEIANRVIALFPKLMSLDYEKDLSPEMKKQIMEGVRFSDLYLVDGVCGGASLQLASARIHGKFDATSQPSEKSRFSQAALSMSGGRFENKLKKKMKNLGMEVVDKDFTKESPFIDQSFQKKLGINVESTKEISKSSVVDFIQNIESLIPKLDTEKSSHFIVCMDKSKSEELKGHDAHAIYFHLSPPYEIQDVNRPGHSMRTNDLQEFKIYLFLYFLVEAPLNYQQIYDVYQVSKREVGLKPQKVNKREFTIDDLPKALEGMKTKEKEIYIQERNKMSQVLKKEAYLEILDEIILKLVDEKDPLTDELIDKYLKDKSISPFVKNIIKEAINRIFLKEE